MDLLQVDVFADTPFGGNPLAVFPDAGDFSAEQMQAIAREMNLSETSFVLAVDGSSYDVRIFTPEEELPFAGHPTIGTAWVLRHLGRLSADEMTQRSPAGDTPVEVAGDLLRFTRDGTVEDDLDRRRPRSSEEIAACLGLTTDEIGLEARELGRSGRLRPALSNAGLSQLMVPLKNLDALARSRADVTALSDFGAEGVYCFTSVKAGLLQARGFFPSLGIPEDPATGSAAAALGLYLADRTGAFDLEVRQGVEMGRPSRIHLSAQAGRVRVGGRCELVLTGRLTRLP